MRHSHAQNFEDVLLDRCFADKSDGFYVDVGAASPVAHNVSLNFYVRGWRGLNVEPIPERADELRWCRPRDIVVQAAASDVRGRATLQRTAGAGGLSALSSEFLPADLPAHTVWPIEVETRTLDDILAEHGVGDIDFLKIDVEGGEDKALAGLDLERWRPAVLVVEAVTPTRPPRPHFAGWEPKLIANSYALAYFDGLNRFYVRNESSHLLAHFDHPACVFDPVGRFEDFGEPLLNRAHPNHEFAMRTAKALLRGFASGGALDGVETFTRDYAPGFLTQTAAVAHAQWAIRQMLVREPKAGEAERLLSGRSLTVGQLMDALFRSDEFRISCACAAV